MGKPCLNDKNIYPDDEVLTQYLGKAKNAWNSFIDLLKIDYPLSTPEWRYYNDGKSWLCKVTKKGKTVCWISVWEKFFRITFYFSDKAEDLLNNNLVDGKIKEQWITREKIGKIRPVTIEVKKKADLKAVKELIEIKGKIK